MQFYTYIKIDAALREYNWKSLGWGQIKHLWTSIGIEFVKIFTMAVGAGKNKSGSYSILSEKAMAPHSSTLAWKIPWTEEPGRLQSMGSWRVGHDWGTSLWLFTFMHWRRKWQPTLVFLPGESQGWESLVRCRPWGPIESDRTEAT